MTSFMPEETPPQQAKEPQRPSAVSATPPQPTPSATSRPPQGPGATERQPIVPPDHFQQAQPSARSTTEPSARSALPPLPPPSAPSQRPMTGQVPVSGGAQRQAGLPPQARQSAPPSQATHQGQTAPQGQPGQPSPQRPPMGAPQPGAQRVGVSPSQPQGPGTSRQQPVGSSRIGMSQEAHSDDLDISDALRGMLKIGASDLHVTTGAPPMARVDGGLSPLEGFPKLTKDSLQRSLYQILTQAQREKFEEELELDFSYALVGEARFRVNLYKQCESVGAAFRVIPYEIKPLESLGIPAAVSKFADLKRGLVLVTGPTGSGKSTTLASLVDLANRSHSSHIMTVEDPIEFLHRHKRSLVNQREVGADTKSFQRALKHVLRQDPDIILIGEMRDLETIQVALTAAETGHLVFATLHTQDAAQTIDRVIDVFPPEQQGQIRTQLATAIQGVLCQALLPRAGTPGRAVAVEVLVANPAIRNLIREGKTHQIHTAMQAGAALGMQSMDQHLATLVKDSVVEYDDAIEICHSFEEFNRLCGRASPERR